MTCYFVVVWSCATGLAVVGTSPERLEACRRRALWYYTLRIARGDGGFRR